MHLVWLIRPLAIGDGGRLQEGSTLAPGTPGKYSYPPVMSGYIVRLFGFRC
jgi:hypothetical protein